MSGKAARGGGCFACGATLATDQEYCTACGARRAASTRAWRSPLLSALAVILLAGGGLALAYGEIEGQADREASAESPSVAQAPAREEAPGEDSGTVPPEATDEGPEPFPGDDELEDEILDQEGEPPEAPPDAGADEISTWPPDRSAWTVVLLSSPNRREARIRAERALEAGLGEVGVLDSSDFSSLRSGFHVAWAGSYESRAGALRASTAARGKGFAGAYPRRVVP